MPTPNDFSNFQFRNQQDDYKTRYQDSATGEQNPQAPGNVPQETLRGLDANQYYPAEQDNRQFSSKMTGDPMQLANEADRNADNFNNLANYLNNNLCTAGSRVENPLNEQENEPHHVGDTNMGTGKTGY
jgi:hypothetical protein